MGSPKPIRTWVECPLTSGLAQKSDSRYLGMGQAATATNAWKVKVETIQKPPGFTKLGSASYLGPNLLTVSRLATHQTNLYAVGKDATWSQPGVWAYDDSSNYSTLVDRGSDAYIPPTRTVFSYDAPTSALDTVVYTSGSTSYALHIGLVDQNLSSPGVGIGQVYWCVTDESPDTSTGYPKGTIVIPPQPVVSSGLTPTIQYAPKLILCGSTAILTIGSQGGIWVATISMAAPWAGWSSATEIVSDYAQAQYGVYATSPIDDDATQWLLFYESTANSKSLLVNRYNTSALLQATGAYTDSAWVSNGKPDITAMAVRCLSTDGAAYLAYAYTTTSGGAPNDTAHVIGGAIAYPGLASNSVSPIDLTNGQNGYPSPWVLDIARAGTVGGEAATHQVVWSPPPSDANGNFNFGVGMTQYTGNTGFSATPKPVCAIFQSAFYGNAGTGTLHANQPRWTNGVVLASRMVVSGNFAYVVGWIPSANVNPTTSGISAVTNSVGGPWWGSTGGVYVSGGVPTTLSTVTIPVIFTGGNGAGAAATAYVGGICSSTGDQTITPSPAGSGYVTPPGVTIGAPPAGGIQATAHTTISAGAVASVIIDNPGAGYSSAPTMTIVGGGGSSAAASCALIGPSGGGSLGVSQVIVTEPGSGYTSAPSPSIGGYGLYFVGGATASATLQTGNNIGNGRQNIQGTFYLFCMDTFTDVSSTQSAGVNVPMRWIGTYAPRLAQSECMYLAQTLPHLAANGAVGSAFFQTDLPFSESLGRAASTACMFDLAPSGGWQNAELGGLTGFASGCPFVTDGSHTREFAFPYYPENIQFELANNTSGLPTGTYQYIVIYTQRDADGNVHRSARSVPLTVEIPSNVTENQEITLAIPTVGFSMGMKGSNATTMSAVPQAPYATIEVYRTINGGTTFYNIEQIIAQSNLNSLAYPYVVITDTTSDTKLEQNTLLYGDGSNGIDPASILDNLCPPAFQGLIVHKNRWWGFNGSDVWYTKAFTTGEGPGFNEEFAFSVDDGSLPVTALASMDERLIVFKRDRIFYVTGDGPADNGTQQDLQPPQRIQSDVGCTNWRGVVTCPVGVWFQSDNGLYLLTRKMEVQPAGKFVEDTLTSYPTITGAVLDMRNGQIVWSAINGSGSGVLILYSWLLDCWTLQEMQMSEGGTPSAVESCTLSDSTLSLTVTDGYKFWRQTSGSGANAYMTNGVYQPMTWTSPQIKGARGVQGFARFGRVRIRTQYLDPHQLTVAFDYNNAGTFAETHTITAAEMAARVTPDVEWLLMPAKPKAETLQIQIQDAQDAVTAPVTGQGPLLVSVAVGVGTYPATPTPIGQRST